MKSKRVRLEEINPGDSISCIQSLERKIIPSNEHMKYIVTIRGTVARVEPPEVFITVESVSAMNFKKEHGTWAQDRSVVKKPPFTVGTTYAFTARYDVMDDAVSEGVYEIYFVAP